MCRRGCKMHVKICGLKAIIDDRLEKMGAGPCSCFLRRRKVKNNAEDHSNLKPPNTSITVQKAQNELAEEGKPKPEKSQAKQEGEQQSLYEILLSKYEIPPDVIINKVKEFRYEELVKATLNFKDDAFLGEGGFGCVYIGKLESTGQIVAVKSLNQDSVQGNAEFQVEVTMLSLACHPNIVTLIGYCAESDKRLLVYDFMPLGSLEQHLHCPKPDMKPLDWDTRMKIAAGTARGLDYLHNHCKPCIIYRDMKSANILLAEGYHPKLSDLGLAKFGPTGDKTHVSTRVMGTMGYCAPEYGMTGKLTMKSDTYSFGVVLLELVTGRRALDKTSDGDQFLIEWAKPMLTDKRTYVKLADPRMKGEFVQRPVRKAVELALMCMNNDHKRRPDMSEVVDALDFVATLNDRSKEQLLRDEDYEMMMKEEREKALAEARMWGEQCKEDAGKIAIATPS